MIIVFINIVAFFIYSYMTHLFVMYFYLLIFTFIYYNVTKYLLYCVQVCTFFLVFTLTGPHCKTVFY